MVLRDHERKQTADMQMRQNEKLDKKLEGEEGRVSFTVTSLLKLNLIQAISGYCCEND